MASTFTADDTGNEYFLAGSALDTPAAAAPATSDVTAAINHPFADAIAAARPFLVVHMLDPKNDVEWR